MKEALCNPVVVRGLHRPFLRRLTDLLSLPPTCQVLSKTFWHLPMPFISYPFLVFLAFFSIAADLSLLY